jgi:beta-N-acetylhexosaminidase
MIERLAHVVLLASFTGPTVPAWLSRRVDAGLGGVCLFGSNALAGTGNGVAACLRAVDPSVLVATDEEGGDVTRLWASSGSPVPGNAALGAVDDVELTRRLHAALGDAVLDVGIDLVLAPVADVNCEPHNPVIGVRSFGADAHLVARHVAAAVEGLQASGVAACVKHWPGHGATRSDSHLTLPVLDVTADVLDARELAPFRAAVTAGAAAVMSAHVVVPACDDVPATISPTLLRDVLRGRLGFTGAVVTDALDMHGIGGPDAIPANVVRALTAGADLCCLGPDASDVVVGSCVAAIVDAVASGSLPEERLHDAAGRVAVIRRPRPTAAPVHCHELAGLGAEAAARAIRVDGELPASMANAHVVELDRPAMIAAGVVPWGFDGLLPDATVERLGDGDGDRAVESALRSAAGRPLVIAVRDADRHAAQAEKLAAMVAARPDAVVVDLGWPSSTPLVGAARITTFGAAPVSARAATDLLARSATVG